MQSIKRFVDRHPKFKNPYFYIGLISVIFGCANIDFNSLTSWALLLQALQDIFKNPVAIVAVIGGIVGVVNDNSTTGLDGLNGKDI